MIRRVMVPSSVFSPAGAHQWAYAVESSASEANRLEKYGKQQVSAASRGMLQTSSHAAVVEPVCATFPILLFAVEDDTADYVA